MKRKEKITRLSGNSIAHVSYEDDHSLAETHDIIVKALPGQSYLKEALHKVSTTQVTGDSLMKVSVGGKGGFGSQGDVREQTKELNADVIRMEKKEFFAQSLEVMQSASDGKLDEVSHDDWTNKHRARMKAKHGEGRDYFDFNYQSACDPRDLLDMMEYLYETQDFRGHVDMKPFKMTQIQGGKPVEVTVDFNRRITKKTLERARNRYDELCGYIGAWKHADRRYKITIVNTLNLDIADTDKVADDVREAQLRGAVQVWDQKMTHYYSHSNNRSDDSRAMMEILDQYTPVHYSERWLNRLGATKVPAKKVEKVVKPLTKVESKASNWVRLRAESYELEWMYLKDFEKIYIESDEDTRLYLDSRFDSRFKRRIERDELELKYQGDYSKVYAKSTDEYADEIKPWLDDHGFDLRDWKLVYKWECTAQGKIMFANQKFN